MKFSIEELTEVLASKVKSPDVVDAVVKELEKLGEEKKEERAETKVPAKKNAFAIIILDEAGEFKDKSLTGYVIKYKDGDDSGAILAKMSEGCRAFNDTKKGKKQPILSISEAFSSLKNKFLKLVGAGLIPQTKEPVRVIFSNNKLV
jgi:hypothetical protein